MRLLVVVATNFKILGTRIAILLLKLTWQTVRKSYRLLMRFCWTLNKLHSVQSISAGKHYCAGN